MDNSIPKVWEREGNGKGSFLKIRNEKDSKKIVNVKGTKKIIPKTDNRRLSFPGIAGNGNGEIFFAENLPRKCVGAIEKYAKFLWSPFLLD